MKSMEEHSGAYRMSRYAVFRLHALPVVYSSSNRQFRYGYSICDLAVLRARSLSFVKNRHSIPDE